MTTTLVRTFKFLLLVVLFQTPAFSENRGIFTDVVFGDSEPARKKPKSTVARTLTDLPKYERYTQMKVSRVDDGEPSPWEIQMGFSLGYASARSSDALKQAVRDSSGSSQNIYLGALGKFSYGQYIRGDLDSYFNIAPTVEAQGAGGVNEQRSIQQYGLMGDLSGSLPVSVGGVTLVPRLGMGLGALGLVSVVNTDSLESSTKTQINGVYWVAGIEARLWERLTLHADFATSLAESSSLTGNNNGNPTETALNDTGFRRFRLGVSYRISDPLSFGVQFMERRMTVDPVGVTPVSEESLRQFGGTLSVHF